MSKVVTANDLPTGIVVFLGPGGTWVPEIAEAALFADAAAAETALVAAHRGGVVDPFVVDKKDEKQGADAMTLRNAIRAYGPTIAYMPASLSAVS